MYSILKKGYQTLQKSIGALERSHYLQGNRCRLISLLFLFLFMSYSVSAATYYVSNSGNDANNGLSEATPWKTLAKVSSQFTFSSGDVVLLKCGDIWREKLNVKRNNISFGSYGSGDNPTIEGADIINAMTSTGSNIWQKTGVTIQPNLMYMNGIVGNQKTSFVACTSEGNWYWDSVTKVFSVYTDGGDPSGNIELGQRNHLVDLLSHQFITISNLTIQHSNEPNIHGFENWQGALHVSGCNYIVVSGCTIQENGFYGTYVLNSSHVTFDRNTFLRNGEDHDLYGLNMRVYSTITGMSNFTFTNNQCNYAGLGLWMHASLKINHITTVDIHGNQFDFNNSAGLYVQHLDSAVVYDNYMDGNGDSVNDGEDYGIGITSCDNTDIYQNIITNQVYNDAIQLYSDGSAMWGSSNNVRIFRNYISGAHGDGIGMAALGNYTCQNLLIAYNTIVSADYGITAFSGGAIASSINIFNNTFYENIRGGVLVQDASFPIVLKNNIFINNGITTGKPDVEIRLSKTGLTTSNNLWYRTSGTILSYNGNKYTTATIKGFDPGAQNADPLFTDAANGDFSLRTGSPAINAGVNLGLTKDILGKSIVGNPDLGAYEFYGPVFNSEFKTICDGSNYQGWTLAGKYERTLLAKSGVDSIVTTTLTVNPKYVVSENKTINSGESYKGWTTTGTYSRTLSSKLGCDSVVTTNLTVNSVIIKQGEIIPSHFTAVWQGLNGLNHMNINVVSAILEDIPLSVDDEVAVFSGSACVGTSKLTQSIVPTDHTTFLTILASQNDGSGNGFIDNDTIVFKIWNNQTKKELQVNAVIYRKDVPTWKTNGRYSPGATTVVEIASYPVYTQQIEILKGYNLISTYVSVQNPIVSSVTKTLLDQGNLIKMQDEVGNSYENWGAFGGWINQLGSLEEAEGYQIQVAKNCTLQVTGRYIAMPFDISLQTGWNIISYPRTDAVNAMNVVQAMIDQNKLLKVQDEAGNSIENWGLFGGWKNGIGNLIPGKAYKVKMSADAILTFQENYPKSAIVAAKPEQTEFYHTSVEGNGTDHMNINITDLNTIGLTVGDELAAFDGAVCVATSKINEANVLSGSACLVSSFSTDAQNPNGFKVGNPIQIRVWSKLKGGESKVNAEVIAGQLKYEKNASVLVKMKSATLATGLSNLNDVVKIDVFPNPCQGRVTVRFSEIPEANSRIEISDISGRKLISRLVTGASEEFYLDSFTSGLYLVRSILGSTEFVQKLIVNK